MKCIRILSILLCAFCLIGCQKAEIKDKIKDIAPQETNVGKPESQEDMQLNEEKTDSNENDSIENINKYMIPEQSFDISLNDWGEVTFVSRHPLSPEYNEWEVASFYLIKDNQVLYKFPYRFEDNSSRGYIGLI